MIQRSKNKSYGVFYGNSNYLSRGVEIMRAFVRIRHVLESSKELSKVVFELRSFMLKNSNKTDQEIKRIWNAIEKLSGPPTETRPMGFRLN